MTIHFHEMFHVFFMFFPLDVPVHHRSKGSKRLIWRQRTTIAVILQVTHAVLRVPEEPAASHLQQ